MLGAGAINVAEIFLITRTLGAGPEAYGAVGALFAAGLLLGAVLARKERSVVAAGRALVGVTLSMALSMVVLGLSPTLAVAALASLAVGVGNGMLNVIAQSIFVRRSPQEVLGRVFAALQGVVGAAMLLATGLGGVLLGVLDVRTLIVGSGAGRRRSPCSRCAVPCSSTAPVAGREPPTDERVLASRAREVTRHDQASPHPAHRTTTGRTPPRRPAALPGVTAQLDDGCGAGAPPSPGPPGSGPGRDERDARWPCARRWRRSSTPP